MATIRSSLKKETEIKVTPYDCYEDGLPNPITFQ